MFVLNVFNEFELNEIVYTEMNLKTGHLEAYRNICNKFNLEQSLNFCKARTKLLFQ